MGGDKHILTESPSTPAFSRISLRALGLVKLLSRCKIKGKTLKKENAQEQRSLCV